MPHDQDDAADAKTLQLLKEILHTPTSVIDIVRRAAAADTRSDRAERAETINSQARTAAGVPHGEDLIDAIRTLKMKAESWEERGRNAVSATRVAREVANVLGIEVGWLMDSVLAEKVRAVQTQCSANNDALRSLVGACGGLREGETAIEAVGRITGRNEPLASDERIALDTLVKVLGGTIEGETLVAAATRLIGAQASGMIARLRHADEYRNTLRGALGDDHPVFTGEPEPRDLVFALARMVDQANHDARVNADRLEHLEDTLGDEHEEGRPLDEAIRKLRNEAAAGRETKRELGETKRELERLKGHFDFLDLFRDTTELLNRETAAEVKRLKGRLAEVTEELRNDRLLIKSAFSRYVRAVGKGGRAELAVKARAAVYALLRGA